MRSALFGTICLLVCAGEAVLQYVTWRCIRRTTVITRAQHGTLVLWTSGLYSFSWAHRFSFCLLFPWSSGSLQLVFSGVPDQTGNGRFTAEIWKIVSTLSSHNISIQWCAERSELDTNNRTVAKEASSFDQSIDTHRRHHWCCFGSSGNALVSI